MEVKYSFSQLQLDAAVKFISKHNPFFRKKNVQIRNQIIQSMENLISNFNTCYSGTMGFILLADREEENIDNNYYSCRIEILVDPSVGLEPNDDDTKEESMDVVITGLND